MLRDQQPHDSRDRMMQFEVARTGVRRELARLQDGPEQHPHLPDAITAALEICAFDAGYVAITSTEPRP